MKIGFIGAGKVGSSLGQYFYNMGMEISGYYSLTSADAVNAAEATQSKAMTATDLVGLSDIVFITVNDDQIKPCGVALSELDGDLKKIFVHTSGAHGSSALSTLKKKGGTIISMHPLQSFADVALAIEALPATAFSVEGSGDRFYDFKSWMSLWTDKWFEIQETDKARYHMAAVIVSNYLVSVLNYGIGVMESLGLSEEAALDALKPLIDGTVRNIYEKGKVHSLTGPISRGDLQTVENHLSVLKKNEEMLYKVLGLKTIEIAREKNPNIESKLNALETLLK